VAEKTAEGRRRVRKRAGRWQRSGDMSYDVVKDCQGLGSPPGVRGRGIRGRSQGTQLVTPAKPLPLPGVSRVFLLHFRTDLELI